MALTLPAASACHMDDKVTAAVPFDSTDEGVELRLRLRIAAGQVAALAIENRRPAGLLAVLRGRRADEVPALVQRLFPFCGPAQDRKSVVEGKRMAVRVEYRGGMIIKTKK